jgi:acyl-coenzyme A thioesterase PaaI-like protein
VSRVNHPSLARLEQLRQLHHANCFACTSSFRLDFGPTPDGGLEAIRTFGNDCCSYDGVVHGGLLSLCIDEAMTCCLLAHGIVAVTGRLNLRYQQPVKPEVITTIRTWLGASNPPLFDVEASIWQQETLRVRANARFMIRPEQASRVNGSKSSKQVG